MSAAGTTASLADRRAEAAERQLGRATATIERLGAELAGMSERVIFMEAAFEHAKNAPETPADPNSADKEVSTELRDSADKVVAELADAVSNAKPETAARDDLSGDAAPSKPNRRRAVKPIVLNQD